MYNYNGGGMYNGGDMNNMPNNTHNMQQPSQDNNKHNKSGCSGCITYLIIGLALSVTWNFVMHGIFGLPKIGWFKAIMLYIEVGIILEFREKYNKGGRY